MQDLSTKESIHLILDILECADITKTKAAELMGLSQPNFSQKLTRGTFRVSELLHLLYSLDYSILLLDEDGEPIADSTERRLLELQEEKDKIEAELSELTLEIAEVKEHMTRKDNQ